jgi:hypothetical protein
MVADFRRIGFPGRKTIPMKDWLNGSIISAARRLSRATKAFS